jgi:hypothetical protein
MEWHINDLSVGGQFSDSERLRAAIQPFLALRAKRPDLRNSIFCSRQLYLRPATQTDNLMKAVLAARDKTFRELAIRWFANGGPFWDDDRATSIDDLFYFYDVDVTDQGLGEAARRILLGVDARSFSFEGAGENICTTPLSVSHGLLEEPIELVSLHNATRVEEISGEPEAAAGSWTSLLDQSKRTHLALIFSEELARQLYPYPFHSGIARRASELLAILNEIANHTKADGAVDSRGQELLQMHFVGEKCAFTDESDANKRDFRVEMTFKDPVQANVQLFCPWHGKIKMQQFRIHFEWPRPKNQAKIKILYIGPKITKR